MNDVWRSLTRYLVPIVVGWLLSLAVVQRTGITESDLTQAVTAGVTAAWVVLWRVVELYFPRIGAVFLGLGVGAPTWGRHEMGRPDDQPDTDVPPADEGRVGLRVVLPVAALVVGLAAVAVLISADTAGAHRRGPVMPHVVAAEDCHGVLYVTYGAEALRGRYLQPVLDDGEVRAELLEVSGRSQPGGRWEPIPAVSGGEGRLRWPGYEQAGAQGSHYGQARVVRTDRDRVVSVPVPISEGCPE